MNIDRVLTCSKDDILFTKQLLNISASQKGPLIFFHIDHFFQKKRFLFLVLIRLFFPSKVIKFDANHEREEHGSLFDVLDDKQESYG